jgi:hypothetical protein
MAIGNPVNPLRWGGFAALLSGGLLIAGDVLRLYVEFLTDPTAFFMSTLFLDGWVGVFVAVVIQLGLIGVYAPQARAAGIPGLAGFVLASIGVELTMGSSFIYPFDRPVIFPWENPEMYWEEPLAAILVFGLSFVLGCVLLGVGMLRAQAYPRAASVLFIIGGLLLLLPVALSDVVFALAMAWVGYILFVGSREAPQPARA